MSTRPRPQPDAATDAGRARALTAVSGAPHAAVDRHLASILAPMSYESEQYRAVAQALTAGRGPGELAVLAVTSARPEEGKTTTAINLSCSLAQASEARTLLVDADLRRPAVAARLALGEARRGLWDLIRDPDLDLEDVAAPIPGVGLAVVPAGRSPDDPYPLLRSPRFGEVLARARGRYGRIVLDAPPLLPVADCRLLATWIDGFVMVVAAHTTPRRLVEAALDAAPPGSVVGIVLNGSTRRIRGYDRYYKPYARVLEARGRGDWR